MMSHLDMAYVPPQSDIILLFLQIKLKPLGVTDLLPKTGFSEHLLANYLATPPAGKEAQG